MTLRTLIELQEKATPGPWKAHQPPESNGYVEIINCKEEICDFYGSNANYDAVLTAAARNFDFAALQKRMEDLEAFAQYVIDDNCDTGYVIKARKVLGE